MKLQLILFLHMLLAGSLTQAQPSVKTDPESYFHALVVSNVDTSLAWYQRVLGLNLRNRINTPERGSRIAVLEKAGMLLELIEVNTSIPSKSLLENKPARTLIQGVTKVGFSVADLDSCHLKLEKLKITFFGNIVKDPFSNKRTFLVSDPDGNLVQFFEK